MQNERGLYQSRSPSRRLSASLYERLPHFLPIWLLCLQRISQKGIILSVSSRKESEFVTAAFKPGIDIGSSHLFEVAETVQKRTHVVIFDCFDHSPHEWILVSKGYDVFRQGLCFCPGNGNHRPGADLLKHPIPRPLADAYQ